MEGNPLCGVFSGLFIRLYVCFNPQPVDAPADTHQVSARLVLLTATPPNYSNEPTARTSGKPAHAPIHAVLTSERDVSTEIVLNSADFLAQLHERFAQRPSQGRQSIAEQEQAKDAEDDNFRHAKTKHARYSRKEEEETEKVRRAFAVEG
jgi:hypothetical protein